MTDCVRNRLVLHVLAAGALVVSAGFCGRCFASDHGHAADHSEEEEVDAEWAAGAAVRGVELGEYVIRAYYPVEAQKSTVRFVLHATVAGERYVETRRIVESRRNKLRDQVITATRLTPLGDFDEPGLESLRRRILLRVRRALPEMAIDDVLVSEFQLTVKSL